MNIEPLKSLLDIYQDKNKLLFHYLPNKTTDKLNNYQYINDIETLFLNDRIIIVNKSTGEIFKKGIIIKLTKEYFTIKTRNTNYKFKYNDYYIFHLPRKNKSQKNNRKFYEELLKSFT
tara:strand:- start:17 stop:370 length:354 start_codon:yes stop_codon:yes gene_type:complete